MALNIYRRHGSNCAAKQALHAMTYEADEHRRNWKNCACPIYASGTIAGKFKRRNTERTAWPGARQIATDWENAGSWLDARSPQPLQTSAQGVPAAEQGPARITIAEAIAAFLAIREGSEIAPATIRKYKTFTAPGRLIGRSVHADSLTLTITSPDFVRLDEWADTGKENRARKLEMRLACRHTRTGPWQRIGLRRDATRALTRWPRSRGNHRVAPDLQRLLRKFPTCSCSWPTMPASEALRGARFVFG
jgi:hypothetical protein